LPEVKPGQTVLSVDSFQELIKLAQGLLKPVHHNAASGIHMYWVNDELTRYQFRLGEELPNEKEPQER